MAAVYYLAIQIFFRAEPLIFTMSAGVSLIQFNEAMVRALITSFFN